MTDYISQRNQRWKKIFPDIKQQGFWGRINRLAIYYQTKCDMLLTQYNIKRNEYEILSSLLYSGSPYTMPPKEITRHAFKTPGAITNGIDNLENKGLVKRMPNSENRRSTIVSLTSKGEQLIRTIFPVYTKMENEMLLPLQNQDVQELTELLKKFLTELEQAKQISTPGLPSREI